MLPDYHSANTCYDFNVYHGGCLVLKQKSMKQAETAMNSLWSDSNNEGDYTSSKYSTGHHSNLLDLFLIICPDKCSSVVSPSLGSSKLMPNQKNPVMFYFIRQFF